MTTERTEKKTITTVGYSMPLDLIFEILLKLPSKSVLRFKSISKSWLSIINSKQFISQSLTRHRFVLAFQDYDGDQVLFYSSPHRDSSFLSLSSMLVLENYSLKMPKFKPYGCSITSVVRGFLCCRLEAGFVVCNPTTRQVIDLSENKSNSNIWSMFLGYDPNNDQYKVLRLTKRSSYIEHSVRTLGGQQSSYSWRPIKTSILYRHFDLDGVRFDGVCIDGVMYYKYITDSNKVLMSFDVGSEQLRSIETPKDLTGRLTNYLGKLAMLCFTYNGFMLWVLDVKNQVWSNKISNIYNEPSMLSSMRFVGITVSGEIVYVQWIDGTFELFCYDVEKKMGNRIRLEGLSKFRSFDPSLSCSYVDNILHL